MPSDKPAEIQRLLRKTFFPQAVAQDEAILEAFDWDGLWGTTWVPELPNGKYELRAVAKDWSGNVDADLAPILTVDVAGGVVTPESPPDVSIEFTANLGGTGVGDPAQLNGNLLNTYNNLPTVVLTIEAPEEPTVLVLVEVIHLMD